MTLILVLAGGALGAVARYLTDRALRSWVGPAFPWGTLVVNVVGSFVLGILTGLAAGANLPDWAHHLAATGFCGALTTYSTFAHETVALAAAREWRYASVNAGATVLAGLGACWLGWALAG
jgi:fluoride exporter